MKFNLSDKVRIVRAIGDVGKGQFVGTTQVVDNVLLDKYVAFNNIGFLWTEDELELAEG